MTTDPEQINAHLDRLSSYAYHYIQDLEEETFVARKQIVAEVGLALCSLGAVMMEGLFAMPPDENTLRAAINEWRSRVDNAPEV